MPKMKVFQVGFPAKQNKKTNKLEKIIAFLPISKIA